jgi:hypothetical protein
MRFSRCSDHTSSLSRMVQLGLNGQRLHLVGPAQPDGVLTATIRSECLEATTWTDPGPRGFRDLVDYFADLERSWPGWTGERSWRSAEGEVSMAARHTGSHVLLEVVLSRQQLDVDGNWDLQFTIQLDAGEELSNVATGIRLEFASPVRRALGGPGLGASASTTRRG